MAPGRRRRRRGGGQDRPKGKSSSRTAPPGGPTTAHDVPDHLLESIFLLLGCTPDLLRAACACKRWFRVVASVAPLVVVGAAGHYHAVDPDYDEDGGAGDPVFVPSPALAIDASHFALDFLPDGTSWWLADSRGSLLLLYTTRNDDNDDDGDRRSLYFPNLIVCEPLTRRYQPIIHPKVLRIHHHLGSFLLDGEEAPAGGSSSAGGPRIGMSNFKVLVALHDYHTWVADRGVPVACVFTSGNHGGWRLVETAASSSDTGVTVPEEAESISFAGRANGSLYWSMAEDGAVLALDEATAGFSLLHFPENIQQGSDDDHYDGSSFRIVAGEDGALRVIRLIDNDLTVFARLRGSDDVWEVEKLVRLPEATSQLPGREDRYFEDEAMILAADATHVLVTPQEETWVFSVELETMEVERTKERNRYAGPAYRCELPWPPTLMDTAERECGRRRRR